MNGKKGRRWNLKMGMGRESRRDSQSISTWGFAFGVSNQSNQTRVCQQWWAWRSVFGTRSKKWMTLQSTTHHICMCHVSMCETLFGKQAFLVGLTHGNWKPPVPPWRHPLMLQRFKAPSIFHYIYNVSTFYGNESNDSININYYI